MPRNTNLFRIAGMFFAVSFFSCNVLSAEDGYRSKLIKEIQSQLSEKDYELAEQLADIRLENAIRQKSIKTIDSPAQQYAQLTITDVVLVESINESKSGNKSKNKWYVGLGYGTSNVGIYKFDLTGTSHNYDEHSIKSTSKKFFVGYKYSESVHFEIYYADLGKGKTLIDNYYTTVNTATSYGLSAKYFPLNFTNVKPYARIGLQMVKTGDTGDNTDGWHQYLQSKNVRPLVGLGLDFPVNEKLTFSFEWEQYGKTGSNDITIAEDTKPTQINPKAIYVSVNYSF